MILDQTLINSICKSIGRGNRVNRLLPFGGKIVIDHVLPFICIYRYREVPDAQFVQLVKTQASYIIVDEQVPVSAMLTCIATSASKQFNAFMVIELWPDADQGSTEFRIFSPESNAPATIKALRKGFGDMGDIYPLLSVQIQETDRRHPEGMTPLFGIDEIKELGVLLLGIGVPNIYKEPKSGRTFAMFFRKFKAKFSETIKKSAFEFTRVQTQSKLDNYLKLGKSRLDNLVRFADKELAAISERMNFLMRITPVNDAKEWENFQKSKYSEPPKFSYRLIPLDPEMEKRKLYKIHIEKIEDPTLAHILREKRMELEKQLIMLEERESNNFKYIGQSLYSETTKKEVEIAERILDHVGDDDGGDEIVDSVAFAREAQIEMDFYRKKFPGMDLEIQIRKDVSGIMVSKGHLLISEDFTLPARRVKALIQHEVGTHVLTYCNGYQQPLAQMYAGFAGYDQLQEGLAVLAEYLVNGLTAYRLKFLAGRVMAVENLIKGGKFLDTFKLLHDRYGFEPKAAYNITMRVHRAGGLTKDAVYFTGLIRLMQYLKNGGHFDILYSGKFQLKHVPVIEELLHRQILNAPYISPSLTSNTAKKKLARVREMSDLSELLTK
jgi:uncharacterized protein (TIGR02421 family)